MRILTLPSILKCCPYLFLAKNEDGVFSLFILFAKFAGQDHAPVGNNPEKLILGPGLVKGTVSYKITTVANEVDYDVIEFVVERINIEMDILPDGSSSRGSHAVNLPDYSVEVVLTIDEKQTRKFSVNLEDSDDKTFGPNEKIAYNCPYIYAVGTDIDLPYHRSMPNLLLPLKGYKLDSLLENVEIEGLRNEIKIALVKDNTVDKVEALLPLNNNGIIANGVPKNLTVSVEETLESSGGNNPFTAQFSIKTKNADTF